MAPSWRHCHNKSPPSGRYILSCLLWIKNRVKCRHLQILVPRLCILADRVCRLVYNSTHSNLQAHACLRYITVPHLATERSLWQRCAPGTVCHPRYEIRTPCWRSDEWLKLACFTCRFANWTLLIGTLHFVLLQFCKVPQQHAFAACH